MVRGEDKVWITEGNCVFFHIPSIFKDGIAECFQKPFFSIEHFKLILMSGNWKNEDFYKPNKRKGAKN
jgi:hypothetical protein